jgi:hypothetical protein
MEQKTTPLNSDKVLEKIKNGEVNVKSKKSIIQAEGKAYNEDAAKADKKVPLPKKTHEALKKKAEAEGKTADQKAAEIVLEEAKSPFPADTEINGYGFLHFRKSWLENLGWSNGMALKIEKNADGSITLRKA